jgi:hypothetical protein
MAVIPVFALVHHRKRHQRSRQLIFRRGSSLPPLDRLAENQFLILQSIQIIFI